MSPIQVFIDGIGFWSEQMPGWSVAKPVLAGQMPLPTEKARRPAPAGLAPAERRRAPDSVCLAMHCADEAVAASGHDAATLACVFASSHGDLPLTDYMCDTVASDAASLSPTKFHNSVHNAPAGYWTIAAGSREASTALAAYNTSFGAGLLEALTQCAAEQRPVLFVAYDVGAKGALAQVTLSEGLLAVALVLSPVRQAQSQFRIDWQLAPGESSAPSQTPAVLSLAGNALADCLPFCEAIACGGPKLVSVAAAKSLTLQTSIESLA